MGNVAKVLVGYLGLALMYGLYLLGQQRSLPVAVAFTHGLYWPVRLIDQAPRLFSCMASGARCN